MTIKITLVGERKFVFEHFKNSAFHICMHCSHMILTSSKLLCLKYPWLFSYLHLKIILLCYKTGSPKCQAAIHRRKKIARPCKKFQKSASFIFKVFCNENKAFNKHFQGLWRMKIILIACLHPPFFLMKSPREKWKNLCHSPYIFVR